MKVASLRILDHWPQIAAIPAK